MTPQERAYLRAITARTPADAKALAEEWAVAPRTEGDGRFMFYWDGDGKQKVVRAAQWEVERFLSNLAREWGNDERPAFD